MIDTETSVADVVLAHSECADVFQRHHIDFCCRGHKSIAVAASDEGVALPALVAALEQAIVTREDSGFDAKSASTAELVQHIVSRHHTYLRESLPFVSRLAVKVARVHGARDPRLATLVTHVGSLVARLGPHLDYEEQVLFPHLTGPGAGEEHAAVVTRELAVMEEDHFEVAALLAKIRDDTAGFTYPEWACNSYRALFAELAHLEHDTFRHVHLENHALLPRFAPRVVAP